MEHKSFELKESSVDMDERTFAGYAATWDLDEGRDVIHRGAFAKSINERFASNKIKVLWQHDQPIGLPTEMREDDVGLFVKAKVSKTALGDEALELMRDGVVDRMSIGYSVPAGKSEYDEAENIRHIREVKLFEFSAVTIPMNEAAIITGVKRLEHQLKTGDDVGRLDDLLAAMKRLEDAIAAKRGPVLDGSIMDGLRDMIRARA